MEHPANETYRLTDQVLGTHNGLSGRTPLEVADGKHRECSAIDPKRPIELFVDFHEGRRELSIVSLKNVA
jgi:hypothetical protein